MPIATDYSFQTMTGSASGSFGAEQKNGEDFNTFLKMLTTQITHQDPLNPMESSDFAVQLATFSGVEQQARTNQLLEGLVSADLSELAGWIGKEALSEAPVWFGDRHLVLDIRPDPDADEVFLVTRDGFDRVISREAIGTGQGQIDWFGRDASGAKIPDGLYRFEIESMRGEQLISTRAARTYAKVAEARIANGQTMLVLEGGGEVPVRDITALRAPRD